MLRPGIVGMRGSIYGHTTTAMHADSEYTPRLTLIKRHSLRAGTYALTACASSEPHEPKHQAWAGSLLTSRNTFRENTVCVYPPQLYSCQMLSDFVRCRQILFPLKPVVPVGAIEVSHAACKDEFRQNPRSHSCCSSIFIITYCYTLACFVFKPASSAQITT